MGVGDEHHPDGWYTWRCKPWRYDTTAHALEVVSRCISTGKITLIMGVSHIHSGTHTCSVVELCTSYIHTLNTRCICTCPHVTLQCSLCRIFCSICSAKPSPARVWRFLLEVDRNQDRGGLDVSLQTAHSLPRRQPKFI